MAACISKYYWRGDMRIEEYFSIESNINITVVSGDFTTKEISSGMGPVWSVPCKWLLGLLANCYIETPQGGPSWPTQHKQLADMLDSWETFPNWKLAYNLL